MGESQSKGSNGQAIGGEPVKQPETYRTKDGKRKRKRRPGDPPKDPNRKKEKKEKSEGKSCRKEPSKNELDRRIKQGCEVISDPKVFQELTQQLTPSQQVEFMDLHLIQQEELLQQYNGGSQVLQPTISATVAAEYERRRKLGWENGFGLTEPPAKTDANGKFPDILDELQFVMRFGKERKKIIEAQKKAKMDQELQETTNINTNDNGVTTSGLPQKNLQKLNQSDNIDHNDHAQNIGNSTSDSSLLSSNIHDNPSSVVTPHTQTTNNSIMTQYDQKAPQPSPGSCSTGSGGLTPERRESMISDTSLYPGNSESKNINNINDCENLMRNLNINTKKNSLKAKFGPNEDDDDDSDNHNDSEEDSYITDEEYEADFGGKDLARVSAEADLALADAAKMLEAQMGKLGST